MSSSKNFEQGLKRQFESAEKKEEIDVTVYLQMMFENSDRHISRATLRDGKSLVIVAGLRSEILSPFPRYKDVHTGTFNQCDILGLVPAIALIVEQRDKTLAASAVERDNASRVILVFEGNSVEVLGRNIWRFMNRWDSWTQVLVNILERDLPIQMDWREFLAGESGYVTMDWYKPLDYDMRTKALDTTTLASKALLQSVLNRSQFENYWIQELVTWLNGLQPQQHVEGTFEMMEEVSS